MFRRAVPNTRKANEGGITSSITGRNDAVFLRNRYQTELDNAHASVVNLVHLLEEEYTNLKYSINRAERIEKNITAHEQERADLYKTLENLLTKETDFESKMWSETQKGRKVKSVTIKQKFNDSDVEDMRYDSMVDYLKQYPEYASKSSFSKILDKIKEKEAEIRNEKQVYHNLASKYNYALQVIAKTILKAEDKLLAYHKVFEEGQKRLSESRYSSSIFHKLSSEKSKADVTIDTLTHRIDQFKNTLNHIKDEINKLDEITY